MSTPTLKNIPLLDVGPSASSSGAPHPAPAPAPALHSMPSNLRPRNNKSSSIFSRDSVPPVPPLKQDDPNNRKFQKELSQSDTEFAARLAESEGIDEVRLRAEEGDAELAMRMAREEAHRRE